MLLSRSLSIWIGHLLACMGCLLRWLLRFQAENRTLYFGPSSKTLLATVKEKIFRLNLLKKNRGCFGCAKSTPITAVDEPSKGLKIQGRTVRKPSISEDFWSSSTYEMDNNSALQSQRSVSSISMSTPMLDQQGAGSTSGPSEFVNHGYLLWIQTRQQWLGNKKPETRPQQPREPKLSWNATYDSLLGSNKPFHHPIPLAEMVDFLVDVWEQEGMYD